MPSGGTERWPALDGLRAFGVVAVMLFHLDRPHLVTGGWLGVDVFFVLSGFLITTLLLRERDGAGSIDARAFYARRALRLFPALAAVLAFTVVLVLTESNLRGVRHDTLTSVPFVVLYIGNWAEVAGHQLAVLGHTWSLAVEEQFYLLWPPLFVLLSRRRSPMRCGAVLMGLAATAVVLRVLAFSVAHWALDTVIFATPTRCDGLLAGCGLAFFLRAGALHRPGARRVLRWATWPAVAVLLLVTETVTAGRLGVDLGIATAVLCTVVIVARVVTDQAAAVGRALTWRPLQWTGQRSYGLYLWHYPVYWSFAYVAVPGPRPRTEADAIVVALSFVVAAVSYACVEQPFLRMKGRFARGRTDPAGARS